jgi:hypothetical protein
MKSVIRNILAILTGVCVGSILNGVIIMISADVIPPPAGAVLTTPEGLLAAMKIMEPKHFLMPWLAHALGTLVGAILAARIAVSYKMRFAMSIGIVFLLGGAYMVAILPSPLWFSLADLLGAYIPMAYLGGRLVSVK